MKLRRLTTRKRWAVTLTVILATMYLFFPSFLPSSSIPICKSLAIPLLLYILCFFRIARPLIGIDGQDLHFCLFHPLALAPFLSLFSLPFHILYYFYILFHPFLQSFGLLEWFGSILSFPPFVDLSLTFSLLFFRILPDLSLFFLFSYFFFIQCFSSI